MSKLELKHLAPYLPYGLNCIYDDEEMKGIDVILLPSSITAILAYQAKPILRPLSDLTNEIEVNGEIFIPALKLAEISIENKIYKDIAPSIKFDYSIVNKPFGKMLKVTKLDQWVVMISFENPFRSKYFIIEKLFEWHFDVFGLIDKKLAIDINTIKQ